MFTALYRLLLKPHSKSEDNRRREFILNILLIGVLLLSLCAILSATSDVLSKGLDYAGASLFMLLGVCATFMALLMLSRKGYFRVAVFPFIAVLLLFATYPIFIWGVLVPQPILMYSLIIVMAGILISSRAAVITALLVTGCLFGVGFLHFSRLVQVDIAWRQENGSYNDVIVFGITFMTLALVSWLSNREIELSLQRARTSEHALRVERNSLEVKVRERTKELEKAQVEKMLELNRFAEFGRVSSALLHELSNPLTSMSLNIEQLKSKKQSRLVNQVRESITFMEQYVDNARRQLRKQSDIRTFDSKHEIERVISFIQPKARAANIKIESKLAKDANLVGDSTRFSQIIANLVVNAIDAYAGTGLALKKIHIISETRAGTLHLHISDKGIGISNEDLPHIFDPFFTTKSSERGTGLGLTITKRSVEEDFQGKIEAISSRRHGTKFTVTLPLP